LIDFIPVIGDIKGFAEAETKGDYFFATLGIIPLYGDAARKVHQAEKAYQAAKAAKNTEKMKAAMIKPAVELICLMIRDKFELNWKKDMGQKILHLQQSLGNHNRV
jgi:hypothetical protein